MKKSERGVVMKIYITYQIPMYGEYKFNIIGYEGPYQKIFSSQDEALEWVRDNDIVIINIDII